jgi:hypothetical protein
LNYEKKLQTVMVKRHRKRETETPNTQIHDHTLSWLGRGTSIKSGGVKLAKEHI